MKGDWLDKGTGLTNANARSINLRLPGYDESAPILEIFQYEKLDKTGNEPNANSKGLGHLAFSVDDVKEVLENVLENGGRKKGKLVRKDFGTGILTFVYVTDPEGNIIEIQNWRAKS